MGKVDENKKQKREALLNTAYELFTQRAPMQLPSLILSDRQAWQRGHFICILKTNTISRTN